MGSASNCAGFFGAHLAAFLFYFFGGASFLLAIPLLMLGLFFFSKKTIQNNWEQLCAALYLIFVGAALLATYSMDFMVSPYPGGLVGLRCAQALLYYFDPIGRMLFLYISLCASIVILFRWSFMFIVQLAIQAAMTTYVVMKKYQVVNKIAYVIGTCAYTIIIRFPVIVAQFVISLLNGTAFDETGMLHPEEEHSLVHNYSPAHPELVEEYDAAEQYESNMRYMKLRFIIWLHH